MRRFISPSENELSELLINFNPQLEDWSGTYQVADNCYLLGSYIQSDVAGVTQIGSSVEATANEVITLVDDLSSRSYWGGRNISFIRG